MTARACAHQLASISFGRFDTMVPVVGSVEALELRSTKSWRKDIAALLHWAREYAPAETKIFVVSIPMIGEATNSLPCSNP